MPRRLVIAVSAAALAFVLSAHSAQPGRLVGKPPLRSTIVEGVGMGGVEIGVTEQEVYGLWGRPKTNNCHGSAGSQPPGYPAYQYGGLNCGWGGGVPRSGVVSALFAPVRKGEYAVVELQLEWGSPKRPKYAGWKTSRGIGLGSPRAALMRAYGRRLSQVPQRTPRADMERVYYTRTQRESTTWVTAFHVPTPESLAGHYPYIADRVAWIEIVSAPAFRHSLRLYAPSGWRP